MDRKQCAVVLQGKSVFTGYNDDFILKECKNIININTELQISINEVSIL